MQLRTKLFLTSSSIVLLLWAGAWWPIQHMISGNFDRLATDNFNATRESLHSLQAEQINRIRQIGTMVMDIPELRALIAEHNFELSSDNLASLQDRLDSLATVIDTRFICVLDSHGSLIAQNSQSPWKTNANLRSYIHESKQAWPLIRNLFDRGSTQQYGLWIFDGQLYQVVGLPLQFSSDPGDGSRPDGALVMASPVTSRLVNDLGEGHNCEITVLSPGTVLASSLSAPRQANALQRYDRNEFPPSKPFSIPIGDVVYASYLEPMEDPPSHTIIGATLIQSSLADAITMQHRVSLSLLGIMSTGLFSAGCISFFVSGAITRPVRELVRAVRRVAAGDMESSIQAGRHDEIGQLATAFNDMVAQLRHRQELQRLVDESQAATKAKSQFLANMSHEIRTPLNGVIGIANLLLSTDLNDKQRHYAQLVRSSTEVLTTLINDILDFSKIEAGKLELEAAEFDLHTIVEDVVELLSQKTFAKGVEMACHLEPAVPSHLIGDANRLRQVLMNLIGNAVKFTDNGEIIVRVTLDETAGDRMRLRFSVIDTGPGIPANRLERLFKSFSQVDASTTRRYGGTGLGLAISKQLAEAMGGQIGVQSTQGQGSTFWFTAQLQTIGRTAAITSVEPSAVHVLVVHPSPCIGDIIAQQLQAAGIKARAVPTSHEAAAALKSESITAMLVDAKLHAADPIQTPDKLVRLLMTTPREDVQQPQLATMGFACSIVKPIRPGLLVQAISALLSPAISTAKTSVTQAPKPRAKGSRILLAEDNQINQIVASDLLVNSGYHVDVVGDGHSAVQALRSSHYDLVLMDCQMPVMDGLDATREIRLHEKQSTTEGKPSRRIPIIALTANASNVDRSRCADAGMDGYCPKPFRPAELLSMVEQFLPKTQTPETTPPPGDETLPRVQNTNPLHLETLLESCTQNSALALKILDKFQQQVSDALPQFHSMAQAGSAVELGRLSHALKGTAGIMGADALRTRLAEMEALAQSEHLENADEQVTELTREIDRCLACIPQLVAELRQKGQPVGSI